MTICFDLDGTLCEHRTDGQYSLARPYPSRIDRVRALYEEGHTIIVNTARGTGTGIDWGEGTREQLADWGVPYHALIVGVKPAAHLYVDDRAVNAGEYFGRV